MKDLQRLSNCPICDNTQFESHLQVKDFTVSHGTFVIEKCTKCNFLLTNPRPSLETIGSYYESNEYISHHDEPDTVFSKVYNKVREVATLQKIDLLEKENHCPQKSVLDIGCGTGYFLEQCKSKGWTVAGMEPDAGARSKANSKLGDVVTNQLTNSVLENKQFSVITMWHALEHVYDLEETMTWIFKHLSNNGVLIIAVPNPESYDAEIYKENWAAYDVPRHLYHFTKASMEKLLHKYHFHLTDVNNMLFDSFYVSLLSTQYKYGSKKLIQSFINGSISNLKGCSSNPKVVNTSSLIYVAKKR